MTLGSLKALYGIEAQITRKTGCDRSGLVYFLARFPNMDLEQVEEVKGLVQEALGYHPGGYGMGKGQYTILGRPNGENDVICTWQCSASCD